MKHMDDVLKRAKNDELSYDAIRDKVLTSGFDENTFELVKGDISVTSKKYASERVGMRISLLYLDLDLDIPTYDTLCSFWDKMTPGGIIVFDEYGYHIWSESNGVDRFIKKYDLKIYSTDVCSPTAYIVKP